MRYTVNGTTASNTSWTWQDEAWRLYNNMTTVTFSPSFAAQNLSVFRLRQNPPDDMEGGAGVREPRRPTPQAPAGSLALTF